MSSYYYYGAAGHAKEEAAQAAKEIYEQAKQQDLAQQSEEVKKLIEKKAFERSVPAADIRYYLGGTEYFGVPRTSAARGQPSVMAVRSKEGKIVWKPIPKEERGLKKLTIKGETYITQSPAFIEKKLKEAYEEALPSEQKELLRLYRKRGWDAEAGARGEVILYQDGTKRVTSPAYYEKGIKRPEAIVPASAAVDVLALQKFSRTKQEPKVMDRVVDQDIKIAEGKISQEEWEKMLKREEYEMRVIRKAEEIQRMEEARLKAADTLMLEEGIKNIGEFSQFITFEAGRILPSGKLKTAYYFMQPIYKAETQMLLGAVPYILDFLLRLPQLPKKTALAAAGLIDKESRTEAWGLQKEAAKAGFEEVKKMLTTKEGWGTLLGVGITAVGIKAITQAKPIPQEEILKI